MAFSNNEYIVNVRLLTDDDIISVPLPSIDVNGRWLLDFVCKNQEVYEERHYFGLRFIDKDSLSVPYKRWIDLNKNVLEQLKGNRSVSFRFKHYPANPFYELNLPKTHYHLYFQLRRDLVTGRLITPASAQVTLPELGALVVQVHIGDYSANYEDSAQPTYLDKFQVLHNQSRNIEEKIMSEHKLLEGKLPFEAAYMLIEKVCTLETYGVDPIRVKSKLNPSRRCHIGVTHRGLVEFLNNSENQVFSWNSINKMTCDGKDFIVQVIQVDQSHKKRIERPSRQFIREKPTQAVNGGYYKSASINGIHTKQLPKKKFEFKCDSKGVASSLLEWAVDSKIFYSALENPDHRLKSIKKSRSFLSRSQTFKFAGRSNARPGLSNTLPLNGVSSSASRPTSVIGVGDSLNKNQTLPRSFNWSMVQNGTSDIIDGASCSSARGNSALHESGAPSMSGVQPNQLFSFFLDIPKRKYAPDAEHRQRKLARTISQSYDAHDSDDESCSPDAAIRALDKATSGEVSTNSNTSRFFAWLRSILPFAGEKENLVTKAPLLSSTPNMKSKKAAAASVGNHVAPNISGDVNDEDDTRPVSKLKLALFSSGVLLGLSAVGVALLLEADIYSPTLAAIRGHPWMLDFESKCYRPVRSALTGLVHRS